MNGINTLIFDFGDVFINLDKYGSVERAMKRFGLPDFDKGMRRANSLYETGKLDTEEFIAYYIDRFPWISREEMIFLWNDIIRDFPEERLDFISRLYDSREYLLILLSNTNALHIEHIKSRVPFYDHFKSQFHQFYLSHEIGLRKPESNIYEFVIDRNNLNPGNCLFIDDTAENTETASKLGINTWNLDPSKDQVTDLFRKFPLS